MIMQKMPVPKPSERFQNLPQLVNRKQLADFGFHHERTIPAIFPGRDFEETWKHSSEDIFYFTAPECDQKRADG